MSSIVSEAAQLHLGEGNNPTVYEEPEAIEDSADAKWKSHNLLSLGFFLLFARISTLC